MKRIKSILLMVTLLVLLVGVASATDISDDTTDTDIADEVSVQYTQTVSQVDTIKTDEITVKDNMENNIIQGNYEESKTKNIQKDTVKKDSVKGDVDPWTLLVSEITLAQAIPGNQMITLKQDYVCSGTISVNSRVTTLCIDGKGNTIDGNQMQVFTIASETTLILKNITIKNSHSSTGGAIYNKGNLTIINCILTNNTANIGGTIFNNCNLTINNTNLTDNNAIEYGGAIYNNGTLSITDSTFTNNTANDGGEIFNDIGSTEINNTLFYKNNPSNFRINYETGKIEVYNNYPNSIDDFCIMLGDEEEYRGNGIDDLTSHTISNTNNIVRLIFNGTNISNTVYILKIVKKVNITCYQDVIDAVNDAKNNEYEQYIMDLQPGNYDETYGMVYADSLTKNILINGNGLTVNGQKSHRFMSIGGGHTLTLENITIENGKAKVGGAIDNNGTLIINNSILINNSADWNSHGGAINNNHGTVTIINSTLNDNKIISSESGGAIYNDNGSVTIINSTLNNNVAVNEGGAIYNNYGTVTIINSTLNGNTAVKGGVIFNTGTILINSSTLNNNKADGDDAMGGAIRNLGRVTIINSTLNNNMASGRTASGGVIDAGGTLIIINSTLNNNIVSGTDLSRGTIINRGANMTIVNSTLESNKVTGSYAYGGIIFYGMSPIINEVSNSIFYNNTPENFIINNRTNKIVLKVDDGYITVGDFTIIVDDEEYTGTGLDELTNITISPDIFNVKLILSGTNSITINNTFILRRSGEITVHDYQGLIDAIAEAHNKEYSKYTINLEEGNYTATSNIIYNESFTRNIVINGNGLTLDGQNTYQFMVIGGGHELTLENLTLTRYIEGFGGIIDNGGMLNIYNAIIENINLTNSQFGAVYSIGKLTVINSTLNNICGIIGGAIYSNGEMTVSNSTLNNNSGFNAGAINNFGNLTIYNTTLENNKASHSGGAIFNRGTLTIINSTLKNNSATMGGAIKSDLGTNFQYNPTLIIINSTLQDCNADEGGAIWNNGNVPNITHSTLQNNYATYYGGAIYNRGGIFSQDSNFTNNSARTAGAIYSDGYVNLINNSFNENTGYETLFLTNSRTVEDNIFNSTDIGLSTVKLTVKDNQESFKVGEDVQLNFTIELDHSKYYDADLLEKLEDITIYINGIANVTTRYSNYTLSNLKPGVYSVYYTTCLHESNNIIFKILESKEKNVNNYTALINAVEEAKNEEYYSYVINLQEGDYNATDNITLSQSATRNIIINGNGLTLDGQDTYQFITIAEGHKLTLENLTINDYKAEIGGAINNNGILTITNTTLNNNQANDGGAIYNNANLTITNSTLNNNRATNNGSAIYNHATANITDNYFITNTAGQTGKAIIDEANAEIRDNINDDTSMFSSTIYTNDDNVWIIHNTFIDEHNTSITISTNNTNPKVKDKINLTLTLLNQFGYKIPGQVINITINDEKYNITTNQYGTGSFEYSIKTNETIVTATYHGNQTYNQNTTIINITAQKLNTKISVDDVNAKVGQACTITGTLLDEKDNPIPQAKIKITVNGSTNTAITNKDGKFNTSITLQKMGEYPITVVFTETSAYNTSTNNTAKITATRTDTKLTLTVSNTTPVNNTQITITAILTDGNNKKLANQNVTLNINGKNYTIKTNTNGQATKTYTPTTLGKQTITATYNGNNQYNNSTKTTSITVKKINTMLTVTASSTTPINNTSINITVTLKDTDGNKLSGQNVTINVAGKTFNVKTNANGIAIQSYTPTKVETQTITVTYKGDSQYNNSTANTNITVKKINSKLSIKVSNTTPINSTSINITATLTDASGKKLSGQNVTINVAGKTYTVKTNANGVAIQSYTPTTLGKQTITVTYKGDSEYNNSTANTNITVNKINTKLVVKASNTTPINNTQINITATLTDTNGNKLAGQNITITVAGKTYTVKTNANGVAIQSYTPVKVETQTITATFKGDSKYNNSTSTCSITVKKINTKLVVKASNTTPTLNTSINITATLTDANGNKLSGQNVTFTVAGKTYTVKTNSNGVATQAYKPTTVGKQTITVTYKGDSQYNNSTATTNITVNKINTKLTLKVSNTTPKVTDTITITATLTDPTGNKVAGQNVTLTVEDKTYTVKTNNNGIATQTHKLTMAGSSTITAKYNGNTNYNTSTTSTKLTVKENLLNTSMTITVNNTKPRVNDNILLTFTLKDEKNNPVKNQEIQVSINGVNRTVKTNNNGVATTNYTVAKKDKNITITATYNGNATYKATMGNLTIDRTYKVDMELLTGSFDSKPGQTVKLIAHIKDNGVDIDGGQLVFKLNGVSLKDENGSAVIVNIKNGLAVLEYKIPDSLGARTHNLTAVYASNTYGRVELTTPMTIGKYTTHIDVNPLYTTSDKITIKAQIVDQNNQALNKQTVISLKVNGKSYSLNTINGTIDYQISQSLNDGYYNITIISGENGKYLGATVKTVLIKSNVTINTNYINNTLNKDSTAKSGDTKTSSIMSILTGSSTVKPGDRLKLIAHLSEDQVDITGGQLVFKLNGVSLKDEKGNGVIVNINQGLGILDYKIPDSLGARTHNLTAVYASKKYGKVELTTSLTMNKLNTHIEAEPTYTSSTTSYIKAKILDDNNQLINKETSVVIKVDGKSYSFNTTTGTINYQIPNTLSKGLHQITIIAGENGKYISSRVNTVLIKT